MSAAGALLFARYAYPPNELGYCGPAGADAMLDPAATAEIGRRAREFEGAWSYLEFLAEAAGLDDPLDRRVVEAYWVGNDLLDDPRVDPAALVVRLRDRFRGQRGGTWREAAERALPHHTFQVFEVYPWAGLLGSRATPTALSVLDQCRIRTGRVVAVHAGCATVESSRLSWDGTSLGAGPAGTGTARWSSGGRSLIAPPVPGDLVALHWDWICDVLTDAQAARLAVLEASYLAYPAAASGAALTARS